MLRHNDRTITGQVMLESRGLGLGQCIDEVAESFGWDTPLAKPAGPLKKGRGFAVYMYGSGIPLLFEGANCFAHLQLDGTLSLGVSTTEMGQGFLTAAAQVAAETLGIRVADVLVEFSDTAKTPDSGPTVGSRSAVMVGNAIFDACSKLRERMLSVAGRHLFSKTDPRDLTIQDGIVSVIGKPEVTQSLAAVAAKAYASQVSLAVVGSWYPPQASFSAVDGQGNPCHAYAFGAQAVEVDVDTETGVITVTRSVQACDVGRALNPLNVEGQMEGGAAQGLGWSIMEESIMEGGILRNAAFHNYMIPTILDVPDLESIIVECPNELGPYGAKGVGEPALIGMAPAIRNALYDALGFPINVIPLTARQVLRSIREHEQGR
jgi:CO/xanthine dehydrogenase Mo-binding subunit